MSEFDKLCESFGVIQQTKRVMYPRQIKLSEEFLRALKDEWFKSKIDEEVSGLIKNKPQKFIKALQFHIKEFEENADIEIDAYKRMMDEDTEQYVAKVEGEEKEDCGCKKENPQKAAKRRKQIEKENIGLEEKSDEYYNARPERYYWADERGWIDKETGKVVEPDTRQEDIYNRRYGSSRYGRRRW